MKINITANGFKELTEIEMYAVDGGWNWELVLGGAALVAACIAVAASALVSLPILASGTLCVCSGLGGYAMGTGFVSK